MNHIKLRSRSTRRISRPSTADKSPTLVLNKGDAAYPATLIGRLGDSAPSALFAIGNIKLLSLPKIIPPEWRQALSDNRLLILSAFPETDTRSTAARAERRNQLVAALADEAYFAHIAPAGTTARLATRVAESGIPILKGPTP